MHKRSGDVEGHLDDDAALVVAQCHVVGAFLASDGPHSLQAVVQRTFQPVSVGMPDANRAWNKWKTTTELGSFFKEIVNNNKYLYNVC